MTRFLNVLYAEDKAAHLRRLIHGCSNGRQTFDLPVSTLARLPGSPFSYWAPSSVLTLMSSPEGFEPEAGSVRVGVQTDDDVRFVRLWWEHRCNGPRVETGWYPLLKGDYASRFYSDIPTELHWHDAGYELRASLSDAPGGRINNAEFYLMPGISWSLRTARFSPTVVPRGCIPTVSRYLAIVDYASPLTYVGLWSSKLYDSLCKLRMERAEHPKFIVGVVKGLPIVREQQERLARLAREGWSARRLLDTVVEVSHAFVAPALLQLGDPSFDGRVSAWAGHVAVVEAELGRVQTGLDELCFELHKIPEEDQRAIIEGFDVVGAAGDDGAELLGEDADSNEDGLVDPRGLTADLVSWAVGVAFGRFDIRVALGTRPWPEEPDPFDPLPVCSPGMLTGDDGLPLLVSPESYPVEVSPVLVDDPGHGLDITARVRSVFDAIFGREADRWWGDVGVALGAKGSEVSGWLGRGFFDHHLKTYSKSRRKAPILWPIGTRTGSYVIWLYAHQVSSDSLFQILNDLVVPKLAVEERELTQLRLDAGADPTASQRKAIDVKERFIGELREFREELESVAPLWMPDLNDGIVIVLAPLWRLFAHHRAWSIELKKHWAKLAVGDYDWAQLAMRLWPDRVVPKCATDRSLAIAHGLEDVFWVQDPGREDKRLPREIPATPVDELIAQRRSPATIAAVHRVST